ncbi:universal stress protein [Hydrogenophaga sp.]|uniref:universal stress protein n=1 Tax=Hydrogenophaga sp. TaxID=1904254 RepID=UPI0027272070|nr:universal stress protein [Hydrogenophaga sp.]MDO9436395.1 universal stress protein [Hydrogenophaga sp.]
MNFDSILAVSDFTPSSEHALERAALLARQHQATLRLAFFAEERHPYLVDPIARLEQRARQLARRHNIAVHALQKMCSIDEVLAEARVCGLLVMGPLMHRHWRKFHRGTALDQAVHASACPLLVVKCEPVSGYKRVLVAIDLSAHSTRLIDMGRRLCKPTELRLFHAIDTIEESRMRMADASFAAIQANRLGSRSQARERLAQLIGSLEPQKPPLSFEVGNGDPAYSAALYQQATQTELVVVGRRKSSPLERLVTGSVAQRLAKWAQSDVLVAPVGVKKGGDIGACA